MKKYFLVLIFVFAIIFTTSFGVDKTSAKSVYAAADNCYETSNCLCVTATSKITVKPDYANLSLSIETKNMVLEEAQSENAKQIQDLISVLKEQDIDESDIKTTAFCVYPEYDFICEQKFTGYKVSNQIIVKVNDLNNIGKIIDAATSAGANMVSGIQFLLEDNTSNYNIALEKAVELAKQKATILSRAADISDIKIISIKELSNNFYIGCERTYFTKSFGGDAFIQTQIMQGDIEIFATVELKYELLN